jgi:hypothetical protein
VLHFQQLFYQPLPAESSIGAVIVPLRQLQ